MARNELNLKNEDQAQSCSRREKNWNISSWDKRIKSNGRISCGVPEDCIKSDSTTSHNSNSTCPYQNLKRPFQIIHTHTTQQHLTAILLTALPTVYIRAWRHSAYSCLYELWPRIGSNSGHKVRQPLQRLRIFSENNNRGKKRLFTCLCNGTPIQVQLQPPKQAQFLFSHHIGQPHSPHWRCYTHSKHWLLCWRKKILNQGRRLNKFPSVQ